MRTTGEVMSSVYKEGDTMHTDYQRVDRAWVSVSIVITIRVRVRVMLRSECPPRTLAASFDRRRCSSMAASKPTTSTVAPRSPAISAVNSSGNPNESYSRNAWAPGTTSAPPSAPPAFCPVTR